MRQSPEIGTRKAEVKNQDAEVSARQCNSVNYIAANDVIGGMKCRNRGMGCNIDYSFRPILLATNECSP
jgi:hypothetical protein